MAPVAPPALTPGPLVSVIIPVFNREASLPAALRSVQAQSYRNIEIIVVDDCSTDASVATAEAACPEAVILRHAANAGPGAARNTGIQSARGKYVAFLDSDDSWVDTKLQRQVDAAEAAVDPLVVFCVTQTLVLMDGGRRRIRPTRGVAAGERWGDFLYIADGFAQTNTFMLSRDLALRIMFEPSLRQHEDSLFFLKAEANGASYLLVEEPLSIWHHDDRSDRLGYAPHRQRTIDFLALAGPLLTRKARLNFEARYLAPLQFRRHPLRALSMVSRAAFAGAIPARHLAATLARFIISERTLNRLRPRPPDVAGP